MKSLLLRVFLAVAILSPVLTTAELIVYKGTRRDTYTGEGHALAVVWRMILIVDHENGQAAYIQYATANHVMHYSTNQWTDVHFVQVTGLRGSCTVIAHSPTQCEIDSGATAEGVYCAGPNATLTLNTDSSVFFAKSLSGSGHGLSDQNKSAQPVLDEGSFRLVFDGHSTVTSNQAGESLDGALDRLIAYVESLGYAP